MDEASAIPQMVVEFFLVLAALHRRRNNFLIGGARNISESSRPQIKLVH